jgi:hypothetical protein
MGGEAEAGRTRATETDRSRLTAGDRCEECDMGDIGTERREVEFEPLTHDPVAEPATDPETEPAPVIER